MVEKWIEIFRAGTHTSSNGETRTFSEDDIKKIVDNYNAANHEAPVVIGHPKDNAPAFGWVESLKAENGILFAKLKQVDNSFADMVKKGLFKKRSISLYPDLSLRHVGFLGAMPPAVKGLADISFNDKEVAICFEFEESQKLGLIGRILKRIREYLIEKEGLDKADQIIDPYYIDSLNTEDTEDAEENTLFAENKRDTINKEEQVNVDELKKQIEKLEGELKDREKRIAEYEEQIAREKMERVEVEFNEFCDKLIKEGKLLPAEKQAAVATLLKLSETKDTIDFGEQKKSLLEAHMAMLSNAKPKVHLGEMTAGEKKGTYDYGEFPGEIDQDRFELHKKAVELVQKEKIDYNAAIKRVMEVR